MTTASELRSGKTHRDENFPVASWIIHPRHRALILSFYNFVRTADDIADHATLSADEKLRYLDLFEAELLGKGDTQPEAAPVLEFCARVVLVGKPRYREPRWSTPAEFRQFLEDEIARWAPVARETNVKLER